MKVKFQSAQYISCFIEEDEVTGILKTIPMKRIEGGLIEAEVVEELKSKYRLLLPDGTTILKKKKFVDIVE